MKTNTTPSMNSSSGNNDNPEGTTINASINRNRVGTILRNMSLGIITAISSIGCDQNAVSNSSIGKTTAQKENNPVVESSDVITLTREQRIDIMIKLSEESVYYSIPEARILDSVEVPEEVTDISDPFIRQANLSQKNIKTVTGYIGQYNSLSPAEKACIHLLYPENQNIIVGGVAYLNTEYPTDQNLDDRPNFRVWPSEEVEQVLSRDSDAIKNIILLD
jgi:hypothetical protein